MQITSVFSNIRSWLAGGNRSKWLIFLLFASSLFVKTMLFHWTTMHSVLLSSLWKAPISFLAFWGGKLIPVLFLSAFVFLSKRQYWTIVVNLLLDIWCIANLFYFKANGFFLTFDMIFMADNMDGFWSSLNAYMGWDIVIFLFITGIYITICCLTKIFSSPQRKTIIGILMIISSLSWASINVFLHQKAEYDGYSKMKDNIIAINMANASKVQLQYCFPFGSVYKDFHVLAWMDESGWAIKYVKSESVLSFFSAMIVYKILNAQSQSNMVYNISGQDKKDITKLLNVEKASNESKSTTNLIYILVESLESWTIDKVFNIKRLPNLTELKNANSILCADLICQTKYGNSADGQMIGVTGLLPISSGATSRIYGKNVYPNFAHMYSNSAIINPSIGAWQQSTMTKSYEFQQLIEPKMGEVWKDIDVINKVLEYSFESDSSFCVLGITITSHVPFKYGADNAVFRIKNMPQAMSDYLNCLHYTDSCIGVLLDSVLNSPLAENTTIVITGDHTIFRDEIGFSDMTRYAQDNNIDFKAGHTFTPLIIYSPNIEGNINITDTCYQMDIFPTILHLIGAEDYYWQGFGVNLLDSVARNSRQITENEAYRLSDLMIRSDYFRHYCAERDTISQPK